MDTVIEHPERWATALGGAALVVWGAKKLSRDRHPVGALLATTGAGLIWRSTRTDTRATARWDARHDRRGVGGDQSRTPRSSTSSGATLERLPAIMPQLASVREGRSTALALGRSMDRPVADRMVRRHHQRHPQRADRLADGRRLGRRQRRLGAFRTADRSDAAPSCASSCSTTRPAAKSGAAFAWAFGDEPSQVIREGLRRFKQLMETGEIPTTEGQPRGQRR